MDLVERCVGFCRVLRARGIPVTPAETLLGARTLGLVDVGDREEVRLGLRTTLVLHRDQYPVFDLAFDEFWGGAALDARRDAPPDTGRQTTQAPVPRPSGVTLESWGGRRPEGTHEDKVPIRAASDAESVGRKNFAGFDNTDAAAFERLARRIARRLALRPSRRWKSARRGRRLDLRRTIRGSLRSGGEPVELEFRRRKIRRTRLVAICDVSGSMELYARFLLQFLHALQNSFAHIETFAFSTRLTRTTTVLKQTRWEDALGGLAREVTDWSGGTRIGASLDQFAGDWLSLVDRRTVVLVLSDGWEIGEPVILAQAMQRIASRAGRIIWLNPLMASADYAPETRGMQAALPYIDVLAPAHNVESLERLIRHLAI